MSSLLNFLPDMGARLNPAAVITVCHGWSVRFIDGLLLACKKSLQLSQWQCCGIEKSAKLYHTIVILRYVFQDAAVGVAQRFGS
ncbi:hypothetical protein Q4485_12235 [Granulosicoccaceae sp. 1_MG-2023]|nr:hypothetical protein [Granulosicoccaceae sp. 1_MG-2023]